MTKKLYVLLVFFNVFLNTGYASPPSSFTSAKKIVYRIFTEHQKTLYCSCKYDKDHQIDLKSCRMNEAMNIKRAHVTEIEHILPTDSFGHQLTCWQNQICELHGKKYKGRKCCEKSDYQFRQVESELYNLWPAVGLVNIARSNFSYGLVDSNNKFYGCEFKIDRITKEVEPSNRTKGIVARATLFMSDKYHIPLAESKRQLYLSWNKAFPPSKWEKEWALQIALVEGYQNPYILLQ